ncbi:MAG: AzlC family ABC transporter permease [Neisseriaceae bacterium]|jgi:predicted branched-subunit amino acid permease
MTDIIALRDKKSIIVAGVKDSTPIWLSFFFMFVSIGALSEQAHFTLINSVFMTMIIFAAPVQSLIIYTISKSHNITYLYIGITVLIINFRFLLNVATLMPFFKENKVLNILLAMILFSASSFTVALIEFKSGKISKYYLHYFLAVAIPSYIVAVLSTIVGYYTLSALHFEKIQMIFTIVLPLHFSALTARRAPDYKVIVATVLGFLSMPILLSTNIMFIDILFALILATGMIIYKRVLS